MKTEDRYFQFPETTALLVIKHNVLEHLYKHAQIRSSDWESGGQIFSRNISDGIVVVSEITGPYSSDQRDRTHWKPNIKQLVTDRQTMFSNGLHVVGLWHTHPEAKPHPSLTDRDTCESHLKLLDKAYAGFLMLTLGNCGTPLNLSVCLSKRSNYTWQQLTEKKAHEIFDHRSFTSIRSEPYTF